MSMLDRALEYAAAGIRVLPVSGVDEKGNSLYKTAGGYPACIGKRPLIQEWTTRATTDPALIREWWKKWPLANIGTPTGGVTDRIVIDVDHHEGGPNGFETLEHLTSIYGDLPRTRTALSGGGGKQLYFRRPDKLFLPISTLGDGIDFRGDKRDGTPGTQVVLPGSRHRSTRLYEWMHEYGLECEEAELPAWVVSIALQQRTQIIKREMEQREEGTKLGKVSKNRHGYILGRLGALRYQGLDEERITEVAFQIAQNEVYPPKTDIGEINDMVSYVMSQPITNYTYDEIGNRNRFEIDYADQLRYCLEQEAWYTWDKTYWRKASKAEIRTFCMSTLDRIKDAVAHATVASPDKLNAWAYAARKSGRIDALVKNCVTAQTLWVDKVAKFDSDPYLLSCANGTFDLRIGQLREHRKEDLITHCIPVAYRRGCRSTVWEDFIGQLCSEPTDESRWDFVRDQGTEAYIQRAVGYSLFGLTNEELFWFLVGEANSGKSTFVEALATLMGDYCCISNPETFLRKPPKDGSSPTPDVAAMCGKRLVISREIPENRRIDETFVNALVDGSPQAGRFMRENNIEFRPCLKLWLTMNATPTADFTQDGTKRRLVCVPFRYKPAEVNPELKHLLQQSPHQEAILAWALEGARNWYSGERLNPLPPRIQKRTEQFWGEQDVLSEWLQIYCDVSPGASERTKDLWDTFFNHCGGDRGVMTKMGCETQRAFCSLLKAHGFVSGRGTNNVAIYRGLELKSLYKSRV